MYDSNLWAIERIVGAAVHELDSGLVLVGNRLTFYRGDWDSLVPQQHIEGIVASYEAPDTPANQRPEFPQFTVQTSVGKAYFAYYLSRARMTSSGVMCTGRRPRAVGQLSFDPA